MQVSDREREWSRSAKAVRPPRVERPMLDVPDRDQIAQILDASRGTWIEQPVLLAASTP